MYLGLDVRFEELYSLEKQVGEGSFGNVYKVDLVTCFSHFFDSSQQPGNSGHSKRRSRSVLSRRKRKMKRGSDPYHVRVCQILTTSKCQ